MTIKVTYNVTDVYMSQSVSPVYINVSYSDGGQSGGGVWGSITGTLSNQTDLQNALNAKFDDPTGTTSQYLRGDGSLATFPALTGYVPYTGATTNVDLGEYELKAGQVTLDTSPTGTAAVGTTRWNDTTGVSETTLKGGNVLLRNGVDLVARVVNKVTPNTTLTKAAYQAVRVSGAQGQRLAIALAQANNDANSADTIGLVIETIPTNQEGFIMAVGQLENINTTGSLQGETWVDGDVLYLSPTIAGAITNVKPTGAGHIVVIGYVEYAHQNNGKIYVKVMNGWELEELHDVDIVSPANNQGLFYESSTALWKNKSISTVLGYTPEQPLTFNSPLSRSVNTVSIPQATGSVNGFLSATDWTTFNNKQNALGFTPVPTSRTITINGVTFDLSADRSWTIAAGLSGTIATGQVAFATAANTIGGSNNLFWDNTNGRLGIGTNAPQNTLDVVKGTAGAMARSAYETASFSLNNDLKIGIYTSSSNGTHGAGLIFGQTNLQASSAYPSFEMQYVYSSTIADNNWRINYTGRAANGVVSTYAANLLNVYADGRIIINPVTVGVTASAKLLLGAATDNGQRLQVYGDTLLRGSGATSATTALTVQNSASTNLFTVRNDNRVTIRDNYIEPYQSGSGVADAIKIVGSNNGATIGIQNTNAVGFSGIEYLSNAGALRVFTGLNNNNGTEFRFNNVATNGYITFLIGSTSAMTIKTNRQIRFHPLASAPSGAEAGDVYYDSTLNKLRVYTTAWETITSI